MEILIIISLLVIIVLDFLVLNRIVIRKEIYPLFDDFKIDIKVDKAQFFEPISEKEKWDNASSINDLIINK